MTTRTYLYDKNKEEAVINSLKVFRFYDNPERRKDFIIKEDFKTGDILLYINTNDFLYDYDVNKNINMLHMKMENMHIFILKVKDLLELILEKMELKIQRMIEMILMQNIIKIII